DARQARLSSHRAVTTSITSARPPPAMTISSPPFTPLLRADLASSARPAPQRWSRPRFVWPPRPTGDPSRPPAAPSNPRRCHHVAYREYESGTPFPLLAPPFTFSLNSP